MTRSAAPADETVSRIESGLARLLRSTLVRLHDRAGAEAGVTIERAGYWLLASLAERGPLRLSELAQAMALDPSTVSRHVQQWERQGLVGRQPDPSDARAVLLAPTPEGTALLGRLRAARHGIVRDILDRWDPSDRQELASLLTRFADDLSAACCPPDGGRP